MNQVKPITNLSVADVQRWKAIAQSLWLASLLLFIAPSVCALDPNIYLTQYGHTAWRVRDGYFSSAPMAITQTQDGHFGLRGMRERAERLRSKFTIDSSPGSGTVMTLVVPGNIIFRKTSVTRIQRIKTFFGLHQVNLEKL
jgi:hypothetical protein